MKIEDAEDIWLCCVMQAPAFADSSLVTEEHLSPRAKTILAEIVRLHRDERWPMISPDQIKTKTPAIRTIPQRFDTLDAASTIRQAETELVEAWGNEQYHRALREAA